MNNKLESKGKDIENSEIKQLKQQIENGFKELNKEKHPKGETMKLIEMQIKEDENDWLIIDHNIIKQ